MLQAYNSSSKNKDPYQLLNLTDQRWESPKNLRKYLDSHCTQAVSHSLMKELIWRALTRTVHLNGKVWVRCFLRAERPSKPQPKKEIQLTTISIQKSLAAEEVAAAGAEMMSHNPWTSVAKELRALLIPPNSHQEELIPATSHQEELIIQNSRQEELTPATSHLEELTPPKHHLEELTLSILNRQHLIMEMMIPVNKVTAVEEAVVQSAVVKSPCPRTSAVQTLQV